MVWIFTLDHSLSGTTSHEQHIISSISFLCTKGRNNFSQNYFITYLRKKPNTYNKRASHKTEYQLVINEDIAWKRETSNYTYYTINSLPHCLSDNIDLVHLHNHSTSITTLPSQLEEVSYEKAIKCSLTLSDVVNWTSVVSPKVNVKYRCGLKAMNY